VLTRADDLPAHPSSQSIRMHRGASEPARRHYPGTNDAPVVGQALGFSLTYVLAGAFGSRGVRSRSPGDCEALTA